RRRSPVGRVVLSRPRRGQGQPFLCAVRTGRAVVVSARQPEALPAVPLPIAGPPHPAGRPTPCRTLVPGAPPLPPSGDPASPPPAPGGGRCGRGLTATWWRGERMEPTFEGLARRGTLPRAGEPVTWEVKRLRSEEEARQAIRAALGAMARLGYSEAAQERVGQ